MTVFRSKRRQNPVLLGLLLLAFVVVIATIWFLFLRGGTGSEPPDPLAATRSKAQEAAQGLDVFIIEYPQGAQGAERSGALGALSRARAAFQDAAPGLAKIDAPATSAIGAGLERLQEAVQGQAQTDEVVSQAEGLLQELLALIRASQTTPTPR